MKMYAKSFWSQWVGVAAVSLVLIGCGGSLPEDISGQAPDVASSIPSSRQIVEQAAANDADTALKILPVEHLDSFTALAQVRSQGQDQPLLMTTEQLETDYEILFGSLSQSLGVTLDTQQVQDNIAYIRQQPETGFFDLTKQPIENNPLGIEAVSFRPVNYSTTVPLPEGERTFAVSGGLLIPEGVSAAQLQGVIVYFHGTTFAKDEVPSSPTNSEMHLNAQLFASQGYIVVLPDYVGQGVDWANVHPYVLYPKVSAQTAVDMLAAVKPTLQEKFGPDQFDTLQLFSVGYSEGGAYSLWFNAYLKENPSLLDPLYTLTHSVGAEGAYSTSEVIYDYLFDDVEVFGANSYNAQSQVLVNIVKPILSADAFLSYATYSLGSNFADTFQPDFFAMKASPTVPQSLCNVNGVQKTIAEAFALSGTNIATELLSSALAKRGNRAQYPGPLELLGSTQNSVTPLVSAQILTPEFQRQLKDVLRAADVDLTSVDDNGVSIITLDQDSVVSPNNFHALVAAYPEKIRYAIVVDHQKLQATSPFSSVVSVPVWLPIDHLGAPTFQMLYALHIFNQY